MAETTDNVINLAEMRKKLRPPPPPETFIESLNSTLQSIDAVRNAARRVPTDG
jgi:hypothetical protein